MGDAKILSLAELEAYDPESPPGKRERPFLCPYCGHTKPRDAAHRSLKANTESGCWTCHRCHTGGRLREWWEERPREPTRRNRKPRLEVPPLTAPVSPDKGKLSRVLRDRVPLSGTPGAVYMETRGIPLDVAVAAGVTYLPRFEHRVPVGNGAWQLVGTSRRVVFEVRNRAGEIVGTQGRAISPDEFGPKAYTSGSISLGVFTTPGAWDAPVLVVAEAPLDALSLHVCGLPALATLGSSLPEWFAVACAVRPVIIATDADDGGDRAAEKWMARLRPLVGNVHRLRPVGHKDWNAWLMADPAGLRSFLAAAVTHCGPGSPATLPNDDGRIHTLLCKTWGELAELLTAVAHHPDDPLSAAWPEVDAAAARGDLPAVQAACARLIAVAHTMARDADPTTPQHRPLPRPPAPRRGALRTSSGPSPVSAPRPLPPPPVAATPAPTRP